MVTSTSTPGSKLMLVCEQGVRSSIGQTERSGTYDLLDNLAGGVQVDQTLVNLELVAIPSLGSLSTRLK